MLVRIDYCRCCLYRFAIDPIGEVVDMVLKYIVHALPIREEPFHVVACGFGVGAIEIYFGSDAVLRESEAECSNV